MVLEKKRKLINQKVSNDRPLGPDFFSLIHLKSPKGWSKGMHVFDYKSH